MPTPSAPKPAEKLNSISAASNGSAATAIFRPPFRRAALPSCVQRHRLRGPGNISVSVKTRRRRRALQRWYRPRLDRDCLLPMSSWNHPISAQELQVRERDSEAVRPNRRPGRHARRVHRHRPRKRGDLSDYRILHFATHGVVTTRAAKCAAQPALLTSFGGEGSDGLLTFREIFDLKLDADLVILSACDTAGKASAAATQQAGLSTGGDVALDGLVRAFVGAGGRLVIASHWPVPDDYNATQRLITGLVLGPAGDCDCDRAKAIAAPADGRSQYVAPLLLGGVRGGMITIKSQPTLR